MNFWDAFHDPATSLMSKLKDENPSLKQIIEDEHCLAKLRDEEELLISFLLKNDIIMELVQNALQPEIDTSLDETLQYSFAHRCTEVLSFRVAKLYDAILNHEEAINFLSNFLRSDETKLNSLTVSFYCKIITSLYMHNTPVMVNIFKTHNFLQCAFDNLKFSAVYELLVSLSARILPDDRPPVKDWLVSEDFGGKLLTTFINTNDFITLENVSFVWAEYVKALRDFCYSFETNDELLENIQRSELVQLLLPHMFPKDKEWDYNVIINGCSILHAYFESSFDFNQPSMDIAKTQMERPKVQVPDPEFIIESLCCEYLADFLTVSYNAWEEADGETMITCLNLIEFVINTSNTKNNKKFVDEFKKFDFVKWINALNENPTSTIAINSVHNIISYMLHSTYTEEAFLIKYLFEDINLMEIIINSTKVELNGLSLITRKAKNSFLYRLAERIEIAKERSQNYAIIRKLISESAIIKEWQNFVDNNLKPYLNENLPEEVVSNQTLSDLSLTADICVDEFMEETNETGNNSSNMSKEHDDKINTNEISTSFPKFEIKSFQAMEVDDLPNELEDMFEKLRSSNSESPKSKDNSLSESTSSDIQTDSLNDTFELICSLPKTESNTPVVEDDWPTANPATNQDVPDLFKNFPKND